MYLLGYSLDNSRSWRSPSLPLRRRRRIVMVENIDRYLEWDTAT